MKKYYEALLLPTEILEIRLCKNKHIGWYIYIIFKSVTYNNH